MAILPLRVEYCNGLGQLFVRQVVVADNHIYAEALCELHLLYGLNAAVHGNDELEAACCSPGNALG